MVKKKRRTKSFPKKPKETPSETVDPYKTREGEDPIEPHHREAPEVGPPPPNKE